MTRQFAPVNPGLWEGLDAFLGTNLAESAHRFNISYNPRFDKDALKAMEILSREQIGTKNFKTEAFVSDIEGMASAFGASQDLIGSLIGETENEKFQKALDLLDFVLSGVKMVPLDKMQAAKEALRQMAVSLSKYAPDAKTISKFLSMVPGMNKYAKPLINFSEKLDEAISILNVGADNCVSKSIDAIRGAVEALRDIEIEDVKKSSKNAPSTNDVKNAIEGKVIDMEEVKEKKEVKKDKKDNTHNSNPKKEETVVSEPMTAEAAAMSQQMMPTYMNPEFNQGYIPDTDGSVPEFIRDGADLGKIDPNKSVPDFIAENAMNVPPVTPQQRVFNPVDQNIYLDPRLANYPFVDQILQIANGVGYFMVPELIVDTSNEPLLIFIRIYNSQAYLYDKSFIIDLGKVIDNRYGIWPCANPNGQFNILESCEEAYRLFNKDEKHLNKDFIQAVIQFGFSNLDPKVKKSNTLYGFRMTETNRVISLITMPTHIRNTENLIPAATRNIIRGACIRMAPSLKEYVIDGRFRFTELNHETMEFTLSNEGMSSYFMGPVVPHKPVTIKCVPAKDENGKFIPASNKEGGTDIKFNISINS